MSKFDITVTRTEHRSHTFEIEAETETEARKKAYLEAYDHDYGEDSCHHADYDITQTWKLTEANMDRFVELD